MLFAKGEIVLHTHNDLDAVGCAVVFQQMLGVPLEQLDINYWGYGYPSHWYWDPYWGGGSTTTTVRTYTQGTFIIDIWDAKEGTIVWRGTAVAAVSENPEKNLKKMEKAVRKMVKKWRKMKPGF